MLGVLSRSAERAARKRRLFRNRGFVSGDDSVEDGRNLRWNSLGGFVSKPWVRARSLCHPRPPARHGDEERGHVRQASGLGERGTAATTESLTEVGTSGAAIRNVTAAGARVAFLGCGSSNGLWAAAPGDAELALESSLLCDSQSFASSFLSIGANAFFVKDLGEVWRTRGDAASTIKIHAPSSLIDGVAEFHDQLVFVDHQGDAARFWRRDGSANPPTLMLTASMPVDGLSSAGSLLYYFGVSAGVRQL